MSVLEVTQVDRGHSGEVAAMPCFLWGAARSGTNLINRILAQSNEFTCYNEDDSRAFHRFLLRNNAVLNSLILESTTRSVFFKSFADTPRGPDVMGFFPTARALYAIRNPLDTIASFVEAFGETSRIWHGWFLQAAAGEDSLLLRLGCCDRVLYNEIRESADLACRRLRTHGSSLPNIAACYFLWQHSFYARLSSECGQRVLVVDYGRLTMSPVDSFGRIADFFGAAPIAIDSTEWHRGYSSADSAASVSGELLAECTTLYQSIAGA